MEGGALPNSHLPMEFLCMAFSTPPAPLSPAARLPFLPLLPLHPQRRGLAATGYLRRDGRRGALVAAQCLSEKVTASGGGAPRASKQAGGWRGLLALLRVRAVLLLDRFLDKQQGAQQFNANSRFLTGPWEPVLEENSCVEAKVVAGGLPSDLHGAFLRIGPNPPVPPTKRHHVFDGEGMIHSVRFHEGRVLYSNAFIETEKMRFERELGEPFFTRIGELYGVWGLAKAILTIPHRQTPDLKPPEVAAVNTAMCLTPQVCLCI